MAFTQQMTWIKEWFNVLDLETAVARLKAGSLPSRPLCITFDDGYADNYAVAAPILKRMQLPATFFVATRFLDGGIMWNDAVIESIRAARMDEMDLSHLGLGRYPLQSIDRRRQAIDDILGRIKYLPASERAATVDRIVALSGATLPTALMMTSDQVRELRADQMGIGAHTDSHPILAREAGGVARKEIEVGKRRLEEITGGSVRLFAYPNGKPGQDYVPEHVRMVRELGFDAAVTTAWGTAGSGADVYQLPRFTPWDASKLRFGLRLMQNAARARAIRV